MGIPEHDRLPADGKLQEQLAKNKLAKEQAKQRAKDKALRKAKQQQQREQLVKDNLMARMLQRAEEEELESERRDARAERRGSLRKRRRQEPASVSEEEGCAAANCTICLAPLEDQATCTTECGHRFHTECVMARPVPHARCASATSARGGWVLK